MSTSPLADLAFFANRSLGGVSADEMNSARGQALLDALHQYDPNARFDPTQDSQGTQLGYTLYFDPSRLPGVGGHGQLGATNVDGGDYAGGSAPITGFSDVGDTFHGKLYNPNAVVDDPLYGRITDRKNVVDDESGWMNYAPLIVGALGMAAPLAFGAAGLGMANGAAAIGGMQGGLAASEGGMAGLGSSAPSWVSSLGRNIPNLGRQVANHDFNPLSLIPYAGAALGLPSWAAAGATTIGNLARGRSPSVNPAQAAMILARLVGGFGG